MGIQNSPDARRGLRASASEVDTSGVRRAIAAVTMGNAMEWYDFSVVTMLSTQFFPIYRYAPFILLALSFVMRTPGAIFLGPLGDKIGRQKVLAMTMIMMSGSTFLIGLLPAFFHRFSLGSGALALVVLLRLVQGFSVGGENGGAATFIAEYAPTRKRGFYGSFLEVGTLTGYIVGALVVVGVRLSSTSQFFFIDWGWRIPFLIALPFGVIGLYLRLKVEDTPTFRAAVKSGDKSDKLPLRETITGHWPMLLTLMGSFLLLNVAEYMLLTAMPGYFHVVLHQGDTVGTLFVVIVEAIMLCCLPFFGALSDRIGPKPLLIVSAVGYIVLGYPCFWLMQHQAPGLIAGFLIMGLLLAPMLAVNASTFPAMFPTRVRYGATAIGYNLSASIFGGTVGLVIALFVSATGLPSVPAGYTVYLILAGVIGLIPILIWPGPLRPGRGQIT